MDDFGVQVVGFEERAPSFEDGMRNLEDTIVDSKVVRRESRDKILTQFVSLSSCF
jgi:hypothetical protein